MFARLHEFFPQRQVVPDRRDSRIARLSKCLVPETHWCQYFGADGETRTPTGFPTTPSRWRVYQFHHVGITARGRSLQAGRTRTSPPDSRRYFGISFAFESPPAGWVDGTSGNVEAPPGTGMLLAGSTGSS